MKALEVINLKKNFGGLTAVNDLSFFVEEFETVGIIGPNGAGKTTVFNLITGLNRPDAGKSLYFGQELTDLAPYRLAHLGISRTFQNLRLFNSLSVLQNIPPSWKPIWDLRQLLIGPENRLINYRYLIKSGIHPVSSIQLAGWVE